MVEIAAEKKPTWQIVMRIIIAVICVIAFALAIFAHRMGALMNFVTVGLMAGCIVVPLARIPYMVKKEMHWRFWKSPFSRENRRYWRPILLRVIFWLLCALLVSKSVVYAQFDPPLLRAVLGMTWGMAIFLALLSLFPKRVGGKPMSIFSAIAAVCLSVVLIDSLYPQLTGKGAVEVHSPFETESVMFHAGHNTLVNYHVAHKSQKHAIDVNLPMPRMLEVPIGEKELEDFACFGAPLIAPAAGEIVKVVSDLPDQEIGTTNAKAPAGNHVVIKMDDTHYALLAHMKQGSASVFEGDQVQIGQRLGECGNSGNTSEPHLHFQVQRYPELFAEGGFTYPVKFNGTTRIRGKSRLSQDGLFYRRNDRMLPNP